ncbi:hypothetical protein CDV31_002192 [Fusarium ambrosium]|uniref:Uncharacterized protein n=1 Tax=Fusarium ambrosium TaxID=131363 RepID=A0A428UXC5_9HYPO|nr:hypothetical protein CDV31_002192 [Fusarium ambrosium]
MVVKVTGGLGLTSNLFTPGFSVSLVSSEWTVGFGVFKLDESLQVVDAVNGRTALLGVILR